MRWPELASIKLKNIKKRKKKEEKVTRFNHIEDLLRPVKNLKVEDKDSDVSSEISDKFEDLHKNSFLKLQPEGYLTKNQADIKTMERFTGNFRNAMKESRKELKIEGQSLVPEDEIKFSSENKDPPVKTKIEVTDEDLTEPLPLINLLARADNETDSSISGVWTRLAIQSQSNPKKFQITPPNFNAFRQNQPHWLERPPITWEDIEKSRKKCEQWFDKNFEFQ